MACRWRTRCGLPALTVAAALIDSINHQAGASGFIASFKSNTSDTVQMYRPGGAYTSSDDNGIAGITLTSYTYVAATSSPPAAPALSWRGTAALMLSLLALGSGAVWWRRRATGPISSTGARQTS